MGLGTSLASGVIGTSANLSLNSLSKSDAAYKTLKGIKTGSGLMSSITSGVSFSYYTYVAVSDPSWGNIGQASVNGIALGLSFGGPYTAWAGFAISALDSYGAFDSFYNDLNFNEELYNNTGMIMVPSLIPAMSGYNFIRLKR